MRSLFVILALVCAVLAQPSASGCTCKSSSEVQWRTPDGQVGGGFSHWGCGTGPYEDKAPAHGQNWCDTEESDCNGGQGWDFCTPSADNFAEAVNVNLGAQNSGGSSGSLGSSSGGISLNVNVNVNGGSSSTPGGITTVRGCTCHPTSEVIMMQNGVRVGGGFSHTGCGTGPYEAQSPGHGSPWCDTIETACAEGWDLCVPPPGSNQPQNNVYIPQNNPYTPTQNSKNNAYTPPQTYIPPQTYTPPPPPPPPSPPQNFYSFTSNAYNSASYLPVPTPLPPTPQPWIPPPVFQPPQIRPTPAVVSFQSYQTIQTISQPQIPSYKTPQSSQPQYVPAYPAQPPKTSVTISTVPAPQSRLVVPQPRSPFAAPKTPPLATTRPVPRTRRRIPNRGGGFDYDYDTSSSSPLLPLMLMKGASSASGSATTSNNLLPFMLASQGGSSSNMLPMMMMMGGSGSSSGTNSMLSNLAMMHAFREGDGDAENTTSLGAIGLSLGFTRAIVSKNDASLNATFSIALPPTVPYLVANSTSFNITNSSLSRKGL